MLSAQLGACVTRVPRPTCRSLLGPPFAPAAASRCANIHELQPLHLSGVTVSPPQVTVLSCQEQLCLRFWHIQSFVNSGGSLLSPDPDTLIPGIGSFCMVVQPATVTVTGRVCEGKVPALVTHYAGWSWAF